MADSAEEPELELEPLFDYRRVQPVNFVCIDDDGSEVPPVPPPKTRKASKPLVDKEEDDVIVIETANNKPKDVEDWLLPPPKVSYDSQKHLCEDSTLKELRLKKEELKSLAKRSAKDVFQEIEESVKKEFSGSLKASSGAVSDQPSKHWRDKAKIVLAIQGKDGTKQFRVYRNDKFERIFNLYAEKVKVDAQRLVFSFDGDKVSMTATPDDLGMEDDDIIEVHVKES